MGACGRGLSPIFSIIAPHDAILRGFTVFNNPWKWALTLNEELKPKNSDLGEIATHNRMNNGSKWSRFRDKFPWIVGRDHSVVQFRFFSCVNWHTNPTAQINIPSFNYQVKNVLLGAPIGWRCDCCLKWKGYLFRTSFIKINSNDNDSKKVWFMIIWNNNIIC